MGKSNIFLLSLLLLISAPGLDAQKLIRNTLITGVCYAGERVNRIYIPPPGSFYRNAGMKGGASIITYYTGFPASAVTAMEYASSILEAVLPEDVRITILASWQNITTKGVLANSSTTGYAAGWTIDAFKPSAYYPVALAEKISGESLNFETEGDIELVVNSSVNWYFGTDGNTPALSYDLVTVIIHELIHGLGFFDSMNADENTGYYGAGSVPLIYDTFVENLQGNKLTDTTIFANPSPEIKEELTGGSLYFNGPLLSEYTFGGRAKLYVPSTFDAGSSISHLDEAATLRENQLMTPFIDKGEAIHDPGKYTLSMLGDLGWINTRIVHDPPGDTEEHLTAITLTATVLSDTLYFRNNVGLVWSVDNFSSSDKVIMNPTEENDSFFATVQIPSYEINLEYYIYVEDEFRRIFRSPSYIKELRHSVYIGTDTEVPNIIHYPAEYYLETVDSVRFEAKATDNIGIDTVYIEYKLNEGNLNYIGLVNNGNDDFSNSLNIKKLEVTGNDSIAYRIIAVDRANSANTKILPEDGFFYIRFEYINRVEESYSTDFNDSAGDFFNNGFEIIIPDGFTRYGLHTKHPYESPEESGDSIGYTSMLRTPLIFDPYGMIISYNELVLVEPGEPGSMFGTKEFYDYVVVEGSVDYGMSWFAISDGYDCRYQKAWETAYNSSIADNNSLFRGNESMLVKHTLFLKPSLNITSGDTLIIRFRLFSDPYANGWGWVIEDLHIGPLIDNVGDIVSDRLVIYPNPGNGHIKVKRNEEETMKPLCFTVYNISGSCVLTGNTTGGDIIDIDISNHPSGFYFIILHDNLGNQTFKYSLIR